jgi:hypothetical protein
MGVNLFSGNKGVLEDKVLRGICGPKRFEIIEG